jgi:TM2 domain-containing membrane protein YozV
MFLTHFLFSNIADLLMDSSGDSNFVYDMMIILIDNTGVFGFVLVMFLLTWFNRMMNGSTSGGWVTVYLLIWTFLPVILFLDDTIISWISGQNNGYLPGFKEYPFMLMGIISSTLFVVLIVVYQRSFHYAITNHRVIFTQHLIIPGDGRRILFDNINEVRTQRTLMGGLLGYNTILCDTGSQLNVGEESMGVSAGAASSGGGGGMLETQLTKSFFFRTFAFLTYQRTRKVELPDPRYCFFSITKWKDIEQLLNVMHQRHSQSGILTELKEQIAGED